MAIPLLNENWKPRWFEHPEYGADMDVAVIPANIVDDDAFIDAYAPPSTNPDQPTTKLTVAQDVFIVGYPYGLASGFGFPIWVRGTIATEPSMFYNHRGRELPLLLVDARTREGQSGAPVIVFRQQNTVVRRNDGLLGVAEQTHSQVVGVYSGRTSAESDLGFCWRIGAVDQICRERKEADITER